MQKQFKTRVKQLKELIKDAHDNMDVVIEQHELEFEVSLAESAEVKNVKFYDGELQAMNHVLVISDQN